MAADAQDSTSQEQNRVWEASECEAALAYLERLQEQLDSLRSTLPSLVSPLMKPAASQAQMFADIRKTALQSQDNIRRFRESWTAEQTHQLFARSKDSFEGNTDLSKASEVPRWGWNEQ